MQIQTQNVYETWLNLVSESPNTRRRYLQEILEFEKWVKEHYGLDVKQFPSRWRQAKYDGEASKERFLDQLNDILKSYFAYLKGKVTPLSVERKISTIMSFLHCFDIPAKPLRVRYPYVVFHNRDITKEEIRKILEHASLRDRCFFLMMAESGLRPSTLLQLRYKHIKDDYERGIIPMRIILPSEILKDRISDRFTFVGEDSVRMLREYLSTRKDLNENSLIFLPEKPERAKGETIGETAMSQKFNKLVLKLGLDSPTVKGKPKSLRLYCLRKYFYNNMRCDSAYRDFWFCHKSINDHYIARTDIERHRQEYLKGYPYLRIYEASENSKTKELEDKLSQAYMTIGQLQQELERQRRESLSISELMELFKDTLPPEIYAKLQAKLNSIKQT